MIGSSKIHRAIASILVLTEIGLNGYVNVHFPHATIVIIVSLGILAVGLFVLATSFGHPLGEALGIVWALFTLLWGHTIFCGYLY